MEKQRKEKAPVLYRILRPFLAGLFKFLYRPTVIGKEYIPQTGRVVLAGNHTHYFDCVLLGITTKRCVYFLAKDELFKGVLAPAFRGMGAIPVNRRTKDVQALASARAKLNEDKIIGIFPEGTINRTDDVIIPFKIGAVKMAYDTGSSIVPFVIKGKYKIFDRGIKIEFMPPMNVVGEDLTEDNQRLMDIISGELSRD